MNGNEKLKLTVSNESRSGKICLRVGGEDVCHLQGSAAP